MSFPPPLSASPVARLFPVISNAKSSDRDPLSKLNLSPQEKSALRNAEANPLEYTLADATEANAYAALLLRVLDVCSGPRGPSSKLSRFTEVLSAKEASDVLDVDPKGVVTHFAIAKLYEALHCLKEKSDKSSVTISSVFYDDNGCLKTELCKPFFAMLHLGKSADKFAQRGASVCLSFILMAACGASRGSTKSAVPLSVRSIEEPMRTLVSWISSELHSFVASSLWAATPSLVTIMDSSEARTMFAEDGGIAFLSRHLRMGHKPASARTGAEASGASAQQVYELVYCMWTMTYECNTSSMVSAHFARDGAVAALVDLVGGAPREKAVRVALSALRNLATVTPFDEMPDASLSKRPISGRFFLNEMIGCGLIKSVDLMKDRQWTDPDILEDLDVLYKLLHENYKEMTHWDVYKAEVESGHLQWGVTHTEKFFKANVKNFEGPDSDFALVKSLVKLVLSDDDDVVSIACYDIGEFVRHYPNGRSIIKRMGAKEVVMRLIEHENEEVQRHALQCVSKMMVQNWTAIN